MPKENLLTRELYRKIKSMDKASMEQTLNNVYEMGAKDALANAAIDLDMDRLRLEIGSVNGIGEKRLDQIMEIIKRFISAAEGKDSNDFQGD